MHRSPVSQIHVELRAARLALLSGGIKPADPPPTTGKEYRGKPCIALLPATPEQRIVEVLDRRASCKNCCADASLSLGQAAALLSTLRVRPSGTRPYPSGGARYPIETYLIGAVGDHARGVFHYDPVAHALTHLRNAPEYFDIASIFHPSPGYAGTAPTVLILTGVWNRITVKYGDFGYILTLLEAGHMAQNVLLMATALDIGARPMAGFMDEVVNELLDIDGVDEQPVYAVSLSPAAPA